MRLFDGLIDRNTVSILRHFIKHPEDIYYITQVAEITGVPVATTFRIINRMVKSEILEIKKVSRTKLYRLKNTTKTNIFRENQEWLD
jgi:DNA-binding IclR family transcriptional regulator